MTKSTFSHGYALIIGVGADLPVTIQDAKGLYDILVDPQRSAYSAENVMLLTSEKATKSDILRGLDWLTDKTLENKEATSIVYFSGHGGLAPNYHLVPYGYNLQDLASTAISGVEFTSKITSIRTKKLVVLLDCCHAGGMAEVKNTSFTKSPIPPELDEVFTRGKGRVIIASSRKDEVSYTGTPYSVFTQALREALSGYGASDRDGFSYVADIAIYVGRMVPNRTQNRQHPILKLSSADNFALSYYAGGNKSPKLLEHAQSYYLPIERIDDDLVAGYRQILKQYQQNLLTAEMRMAQYYDQRAIPLDLEQTKKGILTKIAEMEALVEEEAKNQGWSQPAITPSPPTIEDILHRLDDMESRLGKKLEDIKRGQRAIYQRLSPHTQSTVEKILFELQHQRIDQQTMHNTIEAVRRVLKNIQKNGVKIDDVEIKQFLKDIYMEVTSGLSFNQQFELSLPLIPFLLDYKLSLEGGVDLGAVWEELKKRTISS
ncbi:MAG: caspase family protein [Bdellovibrionales bacterium]|nr:caspase family protein [Bdellovibrionales bacterium]